MYRRVIVVGSAALGVELHTRLPAHWSVTVIEKTSTVVTNPDERFTMLSGDGTSALVLDRAGARSADAIVAALPSMAENLEVCRVVAERFQVETLVAIAEDAVAERELKSAGADVLLAPAALASLLRNRLEQASSILEGVGLQGGELIQITLHHTSPAIDQPLRQFAPQGWTVAAVYRHSELIIPNGNTVLAEGDQLLLIGYPGYLQTVAEYLRVGRTRFPLPFGTDMAVIDLGGDVAEAISEAREFGRAAALPAIGVHSALHQPDGAEEDSSPLVLWHPLEGDAEGTLATLFDRRGIGCICAALPKRSRAGSHRALRRAIEAPQRLLLLARNGVAPDRVVAVIAPELGSPSTMDTALDVAQLFDVPLTVLIVRPPAWMRDSDVDSDVPRWAQCVADRRRHEFSAVMREGNVLRETQRLLKRGDLLVLGRQPHHPRKNMLRPDVLVQLAFTSTCSSLCVPHRHVIA
ncbi:MAG: NAD-binding protein [Chloroflexi bacterium]|nr:NAD-binding protein [Chloroflexota bacterium]